MKWVKLILCSAVLFLGFTTASAASTATANSSFNINSFTWSITGDAVIEIVLSSGEPAVPNAFSENNFEYDEDDPRNRSTPNSSWWGRPDSSAQSSVLNSTGSSTSTSGLITTSAQAAANTVDTIWALSEGTMLYGLLGFNVLSGSGTFTASLDYAYSQSLETSPLIQSYASAESDFRLWYVDQSVDHWENGDLDEYENGIFNGDPIFTVDSTGTLSLEFNITSGDWIHLNAWSKSEAFSFESPAVPVPGAFLLFGSGLLSLLGVRRKQQSRSKT